MELGYWEKFQKLNIHRLFHPRGSTLSLFLLNGHCFLDSGQIVKIGILDPEMWQKFQKLQIQFLSALRIEVELIFPLYGQRFRRIQADFHNCHIILLMSLGHWQKLHIHYISTPEG